MRLKAFIAAIVLAAAAFSAGAGQAAATRPIGFYAPWDAASLASLRRHGADLAAVVPAWISVTGPDHAVAVFPDPAGRAALTALRRPVWLMVQDAVMGAWDGANAAALIHDPAAAAALLDQLEAEGVHDKVRGLVIDFEALPASAQPDLLAFLASARERCRRHGWTLAVTAPPTNPDWNLAALGRASDRVIVMAYDEHWQSGAPGPIASSPWFQAAVARASAQIPPGRTVVAIAAYAYDWPAGGAATILSIPQALALAAAHGAQPERDGASGALHFSYAAGGVQHEVWLSDAAVVTGQIAMARTAGAAGIALWRLGTEDPAVWGSPKAR